MLILFIHGATIKNIHMGINLMTKLLKEFGGKLVITRQGLFKHRYVCYALIDGEMKKVHNDYLKDLLSAYGNRYYCTNGSFDFSWVPFPAPFKVRIIVDDGRLSVGYDSDSDPFRLEVDMYKKFELKLISRMGGGK